MMTKLETHVLQPMIDILSKLGKGEAVAIVHHSDADGCTSAALLSFVVQNLIDEMPFLFPLQGPNNVGKGLINSLRTLNPEMVIVLDMSVDPKKFNIFKGFVLDHHLFEVDIGERNMQYFNPRSFEKNEEDVVPTSYMIYKVLKKFFPEENVSWIAGIGITEDHRVGLCKEVFDDVKMRYPELLKAEEITQEKIENTIFGQMWDMVRSGRMVKGSEGAKTAVLALIECKNRPDQFINGLSENSYRLRKFYERVMQATQDSLRYLDGRGKFYKDKKVIVYEPKGVGLNATTSFLSDKIRQKYPEWVVCVVSKNLRGGKAKISIRLEQSKRNVNLVKMLEELAKEIPSVVGGGHKSAVGVNIDAKDLNKFFEGLLKRV